jgi:hypothetical protein
MKHGEFITVSTAGSINKADALNPTPRPREHRAYLSPATHTQTHHGMKRSAMIGFLMTLTTLGFCVAGQAHAQTPVLTSEALRETGAMLRTGSWGTDAGAYGTPQAFEGVKPEAWPVDGWVRLRVYADRVEREPMSVKPPKKMKLAKRASQEATQAKQTAQSTRPPKRPDFLQTIVEQLTSAEKGDWEAVERMSTVANETALVVGDAIYLRVPGANINAGTSPTYRFKNGTATLLPKLDYRYELKLGEQAFAFTVQNGLRSKTGAIYGDGAQYRIEYDGNVYEYSLGQFGWDSQILAIADLDGDGKPDFIIRVGGSNSGYEAILLSSTAKPGKNAPTASLTSSGC